MADLKKLGNIKEDCLRTVLGMYKRANAGHIAASLSCLDILVSLFFGRLKKDDDFILSKGHAAAALYTVLAKSGRMPEKELESFYQEGTCLAAHPPCNRKIEGIPFGTGSLGHGLSLASGMAFSSKFTKKKTAVYCVLSDGDCNEGSTWEAVLFAAHHKLSNLTVIVDRNKLQGFGRSDEVLNLEPFIDKWKAFNFEVFHAKDGNDLKCLDGAFKKAAFSKSKKPRCIIADTVKGYGVPFMEDKMEWHYLPMSDDQYKAALKACGVKHA